MSLKYIILQVFVNADLYEFYNQSSKSCFKGEFAELCLSRLTINSRIPIFQDE